MRKAIIVSSSLILCSLLFLGGSIDLKSKIYGDLVRDVSIVIEQGVKVQYKFNNSKEIDDIKSKLNIKEEFNFYGENFYYVNQNRESSIEIKGIDNIVEIEIKIFNDNVKIEEIENELKTIFNEKEELKTFSYLKGKLKNEHNLVKDKNSMKKELNVKCLELIEIESGITGVMKLYNNEEYNFSLVSYEKDDNYIIVGSPVIFTTY